MGLLNHKAGRLALAGFVLFHPVKITIKCPGKVVQCGVSSFEHHEITEDLNML